MSIDLQKRALVVGVSTYDIEGSDLPGCREDAELMTHRLERHQDQAPNFSVRSWANQTETGERITRARLRQGLEALFEDFRGSVLFYFSGHGKLTAAGGVLCTSDAQEGDWGISMNEVLELASCSNAYDVTIILDCCHSGAFANIQSAGRDVGLAVLREDITVMSASSSAGVALEYGGNGLFTEALIDGLDGGAAEHMGWVTAPSLYAYAERRFDGFDQRPSYKSHATHIPVLRLCAPLIERLKLYRLVELFPRRDSEYMLDPEYEPEDEFGNPHEPVDQGKVAIAALLKEFRDAGLVTASIPGEQFYWVARRSHSVKLTPRGREYWLLASNGKI